MVFSYAQHIFPGWANNFVRRASPSLRHPWLRAWSALADAGPHARPKHGAPLSSDFMMSLCSVNRVTIVVEREYAVQHSHEN